MLQGYVDECDGFSVKGWAFDKRLNGPPELMVYVDDRQVGILRPDRNRADLERLNIHRPAGFCYQFDSRLPFDSVVSVRTDSGKELVGSPRVYRQDFADMLDGSTDLRKSLSFSFLEGVGIEIGALNNPLPVAPTVMVRYLDRMEPADLKRHYPEVDADAMVTPDIVGEGETLSCLKDESQGFVIANHFLEHVENPIRCIQNLMRVLKPGGILFLALPDKDKTFDQHRKETSIQHLLKDYQVGGKVSRRQHYLQWARFVAGARGSQIQQRAVALAQKRYSIHYHVWTFESALHFISYLAVAHLCPLRVVLVLRNPPNEMIFILRKFSM